MVDLLQTVKATVAGAPGADEVLFALAGDEFENRRRPGLWAKALAHSEGDESKAKATYLRERVEMLKRDKVRIRPILTSRAALLAEYEGNRRWLERPPEVVATAEKERRKAQDAIPALEERVRLGRSRFSGSRAKFKVYPPGCAVLGALLGALFGAYLLSKMPNETSETVYGLGFFGLVVGVIAGLIVSSITPQSLATDMRSLAAARETVARVDHDLSPEFRARVEARQAWIVSQVSAYERQIEGVVE
jgi:hypothetical protein